MEATMKYGSLILLLASLTARAEIYYYHADTVTPPIGDIAAVEARAEHKGGEWHLSWDGVDISLRPAVQDFVDGIDEPLARITCGSVTAMSDAFECYGGYNTLAVEWQADGSATILGGKNELKPLMRLDSLPKPHGDIRIVGAKNISEMIVETNPNAFGRLATEYADEEIDNASKWRYLDREGDTKVALPGGNYLLALVDNDLVYVSGAKINAGHWRKGMLKGHLTPTGYAGYYRLQWYDATGRKLNDESYATIDDSAHTLTLTFPGLDASMRFTSLVESGVSVGGK